MKKVEFNNKILKSWYKVIPSTVPLATIWSIEPYATIYENQMKWLIDTYGGKFCWHFTTVPHYENLLFFEKNEDKIKYQLAWC